MATNLGELYVKLSARTAEFGKQMDKATKVVDAMEKKAGEMAAAVAKPLAPKTQPLEKALESVTKSAVAARKQVEALNMAPAAMARAMPAVIRPAPAVTAAPAALARAMPGLVAPPPAASRPAGATATGPQRWSAPGLPTRVLAPAGAALAGAALGGGGASAEGGGAKSKGLLATVEQAGKKLESVGNKLAGIGAGITAGIVGSVLAAASANAKLAKDLERVKGLLFSLAVEAGEAFAPALRSLGDALSSVLGWVQSLSPATKQMLATMLTVTAATGLAAGVFGKAAGLIGSLAEGAQVARPHLKAVGVALSANLIPIAAVAAAVVGLVLAAGAVYNAWTDSSTGFRSAVLEMLETVKGWGRDVADFFGGLFDSMKSFLLRGVEFFLEGVASQVRGIATLMEPVAGLLGMDRAQGFLAQMKSVTGKQLMSGIGSGLSATQSAVKRGVDVMVDGAKAAGEFIAYGLTKSAQGLAKAAKDLGFGGGSASAQMRGKSGPGPLPQQSTVDTIAAMKSAWEDFLRTAAEVSKTQEGPAFATSMPSSSGTATKAAAALVDAAVKFAKRVEEAGKAFGGKLLSALGGAGGTIGEMLTALGPDGGGPMMAVAGVAGDLLANSVQFQQLAKMLNGFFQMAADTVGAVLLPVLPVVGSVFDVLGTVLSALTPVIASLLSPLESIAPLFQVVAMLLAGLAPIIQIAAQVLAGPLLLAFKALEPALKFLFPAVSNLAAGILWVVQQIAKVWNGLVGGLQWVFEQLARIPIVGKYFARMERSLDKILIPTDGMAAAVRRLKDATYESALAIARDSVARWESYESLKAFNEELSNVPSGWRIEAARYAAQDPNMGPVQSRPVGGGTPQVPVAPVTNNLVVNVDARGAPPGEVAKQVVAELERAQVRRTGSPVVVGRAKAERLR